MLQRAYFCCTTCGFELVASCFRLSIVKLCLSLLPLLLLLLTAFAIVLCLRLVYLSDICDFVDDLHAVRRCGHVHRKLNHDLRGSW